MKNIISLKKQLDSTDMYGKISSMPEHLEHGVSIGREAKLHGMEVETFRYLVVAGMGGSAIGGDLVKSYLSSSIQIPFAVQRHYALPNFVNKHTIVICSSYSGNTEETLAAYDDALSRGAKIIAITTGGTLARKAAADKMPVVTIPSGLAPRAALGYSFAPLITIISRLGLCDNADNDIRLAAAAMRGELAAYSPDAEDNPALKLAEQLHGSIPIIYGSQDHFDAVATRFKGQICENSKCLAFANIFPEFNHNELVGWGELYEFKDKLSVLMLRDREDHARNKARMDIVKVYLREKGVDVIEIPTGAGGYLERIFRTIQFVDFASYYLGLLNGVDPTPVKVIDYLKTKLSETG